MNARELKIGNLVLEGGEVVLLSTNYELFKCLVNVDRGIGFEPIPLTEEWHNKFGTSKNGFKSFEYVLPRKNNIDLKVIFTGDYVMLRQGQGTLEDDVVSIWNKDLTKRDMYVHEWQNLYFALTGEELTIENLQL
jgi:hypothetical protein